MLMKVIIVNMRQHFILQIEERLPKDEQQYIDINALLKRVRARSRSSYMLKREFNEEFKKYLKEYCSIKISKEIFIFLIINKLLKNF